MIMIVVLKITKSYLPAYDLFSVIDVSYLSFCAPVEGGVMKLNNIFTFFMDSKFAN